MEHYRVSCTLTLIVITVVGLPVGDAQTYCSLKVPVPNVDFCDASGLVEENVNADVYRTQGHIEGVQEYQMGNFKIFDEQLTNIISQSGDTDMSIADVQKEITDLAHLLSNIQVVQAYDEALSNEPEFSREKRAAVASQAQLQHLLSAAKLTFQQAVADVANKLQNLTNVIQDKAKATAAKHAQFQTDLTDHQKLLTAAEQQLKTIDASVQQLVNSGPTGVGGANISSVSQEVTDLLINASVAEQIHVRQLDDLEQQITKMEATMKRLPAEIQQYKTDLNNIETNLNKQENSLSSTIGGERILEDRVERFFNNSKTDMASVTNELAEIGKNVTTLGQTIVIDALLKTSQFRKELTDGRKKIDGVQSLVSFTENQQKVQSGQILTMNKIVLQDIKLMKYAFGLLTSYP